MYTYFPGTLLTDVHTTMISSLRQLIYRPRHAHHVLDGVRDLALGGIFIELILARVFLEMVFMICHAHHALAVSCAWSS